MSCRDDPPVVIERRRRFRRTRKAEDQPAMGELIALMIEAVTGGVALRLLVEPDRGRG